MRNTLRTALAFLVLSVLTGLCSVVYAAPFAKIIKFTQPDGTVIQLWAQGDEFHAVFETLDGYTVVFDTATKSYRYATLDAAGKDLADSGIEVGKGHARDQGIAQHVRMDRELVKARSKQRHKDWDDSLQITKRWNQLKAQGVQPAAGANGSGAGDIQASPPSKPTLGTRIGLTLMVDFPDVPGTIPQSEIDGLCNGDNYTGYGNFCSVKKYYQDMSNGQLTYTNVVTAYIRAMSNSPKCLTYLALK